jgi:hypothetical protein
VELQVVKITWIGETIARLGHAYPAASRRYQNACGIGTGPIAAGHDAIVHGQQQTNNVR